MIKAIEILSTTDLVLYIGIPTLIVLMIWIGLTLRSIKKRLDKI